MLWAPVFFAIGVGLYFALPTEPALYTGGGASIILLIVLLVFWRFFLMRLFLLALLLGAGGFTAANVRSWALATPVLEKKMSPRRITGLVADVRRYNSGKMHIVLENPEIPGGIRLDKIRLKVQKFDVLPHPGDRVSIMAGLLLPPPPTMPGDFDYARQIWFQGFGAVGYAISKPKIIEKGQGAYGLQARKRFVMAEDIRATIEGDTGGLAAALITGMRDGISRDVVENMRNSGLAHLLAISGLHMGLLCGAAFFFCRFLLSRSEYLTLRYPIKKWAAIVAIGAGAVYVFLSGGSTPTVRAFIMAVILFLGVLTDRKAISLRLVAIAAMVILFLTPEVILSVSFQMSFAAVVALVAAYEKIKGRWSNISERNQGGFKKAAFYVGTMLFTTLVAELAIAPFALFHFNKLVQYGLVANLVAMPVMASWVMPCVVAYLILSPFGLGALALYPMSYGLEVIMFVAKTVSHTPGSYSLVPTMGVLPLLLMTLGALWFVIWRSRWNRLGLPVVLIGIVSAFFTTQPDILIDNGGRLIGVRNANEEISLSSLRAGRMTRQRWALRNGQEKAEKWLYNGNRMTEETWMSCDRLSCLYRPAHKSTETLIALVKDELALSEDCLNAQVVISLVPVEVACPSAHIVIDKWDFYHKGGHALWLPEK
ncbi:MAG: ComEC/Rec2 family competence protein, partial [Emcibacter sp.]|nr:ComEC/Rec2 family competence protein [Emcibacter sp.]